jgi:riboflavin kinase/FMN adenylyltransferase
MRLLHHLRELQPAGRPVCAALGMFDGVHLGHQHIVASSVAAARDCGGLALVVTFDRHPAAIVAPERVPQLLQPLSARLAALERLQPEALWLISFDEAFSHKSGAEFIRELARDAAPLRRVCVGENFHFGHQRTGNAALLRQLSGELGFEFAAAGPVQADGQAISSTRIREAVRQGEFASAERLLGRPYELTGAVVRGDQVGRQLGYPTANLDVAGLVVPPHGVYATRGVIGGREFPGVTNLGLRPTLREAKPRLHVETHLFDFDGELYGQNVALRFAAKLRDEQRFASLEELRAQIQRDAAAARQVLGAAEFR